MFDSLTRFFLIAHDGPNPAKLSDVFNSYMEQAKLEGAVSFVKKLREDKRLGLEYWVQQQDPQTGETLLHLVLRHLIQYSEYPNSTDESRQFDLCVHLADMMLTEGEKKYAVNIFLRNIFNQTCYDLIRQAPMMWWLKNSDGSVEPYPKSSNDTYVIKSSAAPIPGTFLASLPTNSINISRDVASQHKIWDIFNQAVKGDPDVFEDATAITDEVKKLVYKMGNMQELNIKSLRNIYLTEKITITHIQKQLLFKTAQGKIDVALNSTILSVREHFTNYKYSWIILHLAHEVFRVRMTAHEDPTRYLTQLTQRLFHTEMCIQLIGALENKIFSNSIKPLLLQAISEKLFLSEVINEILEKANRNEYPSGLALSVYKLHESQWHRFGLFGNENDTIKMAQELQDTESKIRRSSF